MRILVFSEVYWPEHFMVNDLTQQWAESGYEVEVVSQYPSYPQGYTYDGYENKGYRTQKWGRITIYRFPFIEGYRDSRVRKFANYLKYISGAKRVVRQLKKEGKEYDVVFVSQTGPLTVALPSLYAGRLFGVATAIWTFDLWPETLYMYGVPERRWIDRLLRAFVGKVYRRCDRVLVSSRAFIKEIEKYTDKEVVYAPNWLIDGQREEVAIHLEEEKFNFVFAGNISKSQNLMNVVEAFARAGMEDAMLNIVGDGSTAEVLRQKVETLGCERIVMWPRQASGTIAALLEEADVLVLPLISNRGIAMVEPLKLQTYLRAGKPIMAVDCGSSSEIVMDNGLGLATDPDDIDGIAECFKKMVGFAQNNGQSVREASKRLLKSRFDRKSTIDTITECLCALTQQKTKKASNKENIR